jgi:hypothetical protein
MSAEMALLRHIPCPSPRGHGAWNSKTAQKCRPRISGLPMGMSE